MAKPSAFAVLRTRVLAAVANVPPGRVTTYGAIGASLGTTARQVAFILARLDKRESADLPWHRVIGAGGVLRTIASHARRQAAKLRADGLTVSASGTVTGFTDAFWPPA